MCSGETLQNAVHSVSFKDPGFKHEGIAGYIETEYEIIIKDLEAFANLWNSYYSLSDKRKLDLYRLSKGLGGL